MDFVESGLWSHFNYELCGCRTVDGFYKSFWRVLNVDHVKLKLWRHFKLGQYVSAMEASLLWS